MSVHTANLVKLKVNHLRTDADLVMLIIPIYFTCLISLISFIFFYFSLQESTRSVGFALPAAYFASLWGERGTTSQEQGGEIEQGNWSAEWSKRTVSPFESGGHMSVFLPAVLSESKLIASCLHHAN